ncbi:hypothetical protein GJ744_010488 [Endocarpon pusillum]|uniref:Uncharacterized protein n=1 Tax=Endocarpon pusillum TaxID=364733 RepID=A0A8H7E1T7_9EURO|nr:hypothetical protein GJ744_010488 [Endocarpon pusillum]
MNDEPQAVPFANFGTQAIKLTEGRLLGYLEEVLPEEIGPKVVEDMHMIEIYLGETELGYNQPFVLAKDRDEDQDA